MKLSFARPCRPYRADRQPRRPQVARTSSQAAALQPQRSPAINSLAPGWRGALEGEGGVD